MAKNYVSYENMMDIARTLKAQRGAAGGVAPLDENGHVPSSNLPSFVDDVLEFPTKDDFPDEGEAGKIYIAVNTNVPYRWSGTQYVEISASLALGETSSTAYPGDKGKAVADGLEQEIIDRTDADTKINGKIGEMGDLITVEKDTLVDAINDLVRNRGVTLPAGTVIPYAGTIIPAGWLACEGQEVSRITYAALFEAIGTSYGAGDGSTTFRIPDYREAALVGIGQRASGVADHDVYTLGQFKDDQLQNIVGLIAIVGNESAPSFLTPKGGYGALKVGGEILGSLAGVTTSTTSGMGRYIEFNASDSARAGTTTHGKRMGVNYIIKWRRQGSVDIDIDVDTLINQKIAAAMTRANENLYKNIATSFQTVANPQYGQVVTLPYDGIYYVATTYRVNITNGQVSLRHNNITMSNIENASTGNFNLNATIIAKTGDTLTLISTEGTTNLLNSNILYVGRLNLA